MRVRVATRWSRIAPRAAVVGLVAAATLLVTAVPCRGTAVADACATRTTLTMSPSVVWSHAARLQIAVTSRCGVPKGYCTMAFEDGGRRTKRLDSHGRCTFKRFLLDRLGPQRRWALFEPARGWRASRSAVKTVVVLRPDIPVDPAAAILGAKLYPNGLRPGTPTIVPLGSPVQWCPGEPGTLAVATIVRGRSDDTVSAEFSLPDGTTERFGQSTIGRGFGVTAIGIEWELLFQPSVAGNAHVVLHLRRAGVAADIASAAADIAITCAAPPPV